MPTRDKGHLLGLLLANRAHRKPIGRYRNLRLLKINSSSGMVIITTTIITVIIIIGVITINMCASLFSAYPDITYILFKKLLVMP